MKKITAITSGIFLFFLSVSAYAQDTCLIAASPLAITYAKTTNLIFPYPITSIDRGSRDILVQKAIGVENVLQVKAAKANFPPTNLTIVTADGSLFSYALSYADEPTELNIKVQPKQSAGGSLAVFTKSATNDVIQLNAAKVAVKRKSVKCSSDENHGASINVKGLYVQDEVLYFQLDLKNSSALNYDIKMLRFFIKDKKKSRRTASQEITIDPVYILGNTNLIRNNSEQVVVIAVPKFTIPDRKQFIIQMLEENGGRNLHLNINNKDIFKAGMVY